MSASASANYYHSIASLPTTEFYQELYYDNDADHSTVASELPVSVSKAVILCADISTTDY